MTSSLVLTFAVGEIPFVGWKIVAASFDSRGYIVVSMLEKSAHFEVRRHDSRPVWMLQTRVEICWSWVGILQ